MGWTSGTLTYGYDLQIDLTDIANAIAQRFPGKMEYFEQDGDDLIMHFEHETGYKHWHCPRTMEEPEENETELINSVEYVNLKQEIIEALRKIEPEELSVNVNIEDVDEWEWGDK